MSEYQLTQEILARSVARSWPDAKLEWELREVYEAAEAETCLCGHFPIIDLCVLGNRVNGRTATVGNCCARKFLGLPSDEIFRALKRVGRDPTRSLTAEAIGHAFGIGWINEWERDFYLDIAGRRKLSEKQIAKRIQINRKVIATMRTQGHARG